MCASCASGYRAPAAMPGGNALASAARCASVNLTSSAPSASESRSRRRAPTSGTMSLPCAATQAMATCAGDAPSSSAIARSSLDQRQVGVEIAALEARAHRAEILRAGALLRPVPADQPARQHAIGGDADAELAAGRQDVALDAARDQRVLDLQIGDRMHRVRAADGFGADFRQADVPIAARLHHVGDRADRVLDRHVGIEPRRAVDVDVVDAEPLQRVGEESSSPPPGGRR